MAVGRDKYNICYKPFLYSNSRWQLYLGDITSSVVTVSLSVPVIGAITGNSNVCPGATINLSDTTNGGTWSSDNTAIATVNSSGIVSGVAAGTTHIVYTVTNGVCSDSVIKTITVLSPPVVSPISGPATVCVSATINLNSGPTGGTWSSDNTAIATVSSSGAVTGIVAGSTNIVYSVTNGSGCTDSAIKTITVNALPVMSATGGGYWSMPGCYYKLN